MSKTKKRKVAVNPDKALKLWVSQLVHHKLEEVIRITSPEWGDMEMNVYSFDKLETGLRVKTSNAGTHYYQIRVAESWT